MERDERTFLVGQRSCTRSDRYTGLFGWGTLYLTTASLNWIRCPIGSQCRHFLKSNALLSLTPRTVLASKFELIGGDLEHANTFRAQQSWNSPTSLLQVIADCLYHVRGQHRMECLRRRRWKLQVQTVSETSLTSVRVSSRTPSSLTEFIS